MASKAKTCDTALNFALETLSAKDALILGQGKLIELRAKEIGVLKELDQNWQSRQDNLIKTQELQTAKLKAKVKKRNKIIFGESLGIVVLLILLL